jgi:hypothetical protein
VISYREHKDSAIWAVEIDASSAGGAVPARYTPIVPMLPSIDLAASTRDKESGTR